MYPNEPGYENDIIICAFGINGLAKKTRPEGPVSRDPWYNDIVHKQRETPAINT